MQHRSEDEQKKKKSIALKVVMEKVEESENKLSSDNAIQDEDLAMIVKKFRKFMRRRKRFSRRVLRNEK